MLWIAHRGQGGLRFVPAQAPGEPLFPTGAFQRELLLRLLQPFGAEPPQGAHQLVVVRVGHGTVPQPGQNVRP